MPTPEEDTAVTAAALRDRDNPPLDDGFFERARRGRPPMAPELKKRQITILLDPDVIDRLKAGGPGWQTRANAMLRHALGLPEERR